MRGSGTVPREPARDSRSQLPDRVSFYADIAAAVASADTANTSLVLLEIDVDGVDFILRTFGPRERDLLLRDLGQRIVEVAGNASPAYHITQDRFALVVAKRSCRQATQLAEELVARLRAPFEVAGVSYHLSAHVGISHYPNHAESISELVRSAVFACHQARLMDATHAAFDRETDERERHRFRLMVDLERALESDDQIRLAYQPQVDLQTGRCVGVEGLCRWHHPYLGPVPPGEFLPFVEHTPLMMPLTEATLAEALADLSTWRAQGFDGSVAINLSPVLFRRGDFLERLLEHFRFYDVAREKLDFEVTETGIMEQPNRAAHALMEVRRGGSRIAVDDFGTGHSSLAYLADLPIDAIKIDRFFVQSLSQPWGEAIVGAAATLAQKLGLATVAEGIETEGQCAKCRELGVTLGQGFHTGRPMFKEDLRAWLAR